MFRYSFFVLALILFKNEREIFKSDARSLPPSDEGGGFCEAKDGGRDK